MHRDRRLAFDAARREQVRVADFVFIVAEVAYLDQTLGYERIEAEIELPKASAQLTSKCALAQIGPVFQQAQQTQVSVIDRVIYGGGHGGCGVANLCNEEGCATSSFNL